MTTVRQYNFDEYEAVVKVRLRALQDSDWAFTSKFETENTWGKEEWEKRWENRTWFLSHDENKHNGMIGILEEETTTESEFQLIGMWVDPASRGTNTAKELVNAVIEHIKSIGGHEICLLVFPTNNRAVDFYKKVGFKLIDEKFETPNDPGAPYHKYSLKL